ncbi:MAG: proton-dependent oligopeptide transporter, family [Thermoanaerobaculia bacterium]|jgi:POT family proton-dependent oligopeptide transporter|nr:proton-dependent oligopeptide transporter, family [Thermoanaerobaculia bacterium]
MAGMSETAVAEEQWFGHPRGLATCFFTEMWERFSYYGMRALLLLYMLAPPDKGGLGFATEKGASIYGWYTMGVYAMSIPGGWIADKLLGLYRSVLLGGIIIASGHFLMAYPSIQTFYLGLILIVCGTGLLKPNVSGIVGTLYSKDDVRRDAGFSVFYMGINLGAFIAPLICGPLGQRINWHWGFGAAGVGMTLGVIQYIAGKKHIAPGLARMAKNEADDRVAEKAAGKSPSFTPQEWKRISVIGILFFFSVLFWGAFEQAGSSLNLFADRLTRLNFAGWNFPSSTFQSVQPLFIIALSPVFGWIWLRLGRHEPSSPAKFSLGLLFVGLSFLLLVPGAAIAQSQGIKVSPMWLVGVYFLQTVGELCLSPVGLSMVTKLAPPRIVGLMLGVFFLSISLGNKLGGYCAGFFDRLPLPTLFGAVAGTTLTAGLILFVLVKPIRRLMGGVH